MSDLAPTRKVTVAAVSGAMSTIFVYLIQRITGETVPAEVAAAFTTLVSFAVAYMTPSEPEWTERELAVLHRAADEAPDPPGWRPA